MKIRIKPVHYKRDRGWDFAPRIDSWQMYGKPSYDYRRFYSIDIGQNFGRGYAGIQIQVTWYWSKR